MPYNSYYIIKICLGKKMKLHLNLNFKEFFWGKLKKITNSFSDFKVEYLGDGNIKCFWNISRLDNFKIRFSSSYFYAIRLFDITNNRNKNEATCIMKEIQVSKSKSSFSFKIPVDKGVYSFEFGYRKPNGEWRRLAFQDLNLGYRITRMLNSLSHDEWFISDKNRKHNFSQMHDISYQMSLNSKIGGSDQIFK